MEDEKKEVVSEQDGQGNETKDNASATETKAAESKDDKKDEKKDESKKDSGFSKWWKGTKAKVDADLLESHIQNTYAGAHQNFDVYTHEGRLFNGESVVGEIVDGSLIYWGEKAIGEAAVVVNPKDQKAYYTLKSEPIDLKVTYEKTEYTRKGTKTALDPNVEEVDVIKAGKRYFLYKGEKAAKK
jgi:hypothetical protein